MVHGDKRLYLVFEYLDLDLKKYMDTHPQLCKDHRLVKVKYDQEIKFSLSALLSELFLLIGSLQLALSDGFLNVPPALSLSDATGHRLLPFPQVNLDSLMCFF